MMSFDEVNKLVGTKRSIPYKKYFGEMKISKEQKEKREEFAMLLETLLTYSMIYLLTIKNYGGSYEQAVEKIEEAYLEAIKSTDVVLDDEYSEYVKQYAENFVRVTKDNESDWYYFSLDRVKVNAENEANALYNHNDYKTAVISGMRWKEWEAIIDGSTRTTHLKTNKTRIPIDGLFLVGNALMRYAKDIEYASDHPEELANCRCSTTYSK